MNTQIRIKPNQPNFTDVLLSQPEAALKQIVNVRSQSVYEVITQDDSGVFHVESVSHGRYVKTSFRIGDEGHKRYRIIGGCSCGNMKCFHAGAAIYFLSSRMPTERLPQPSNPVPGPKLSGGATALLASLNKVEPAPRQSAQVLRFPSAVPNEVVVYSLGTEGITLGTAKVLKRGGYSKSHKTGGAWSYAIGRQKTPQYFGYEQPFPLNDEDRRIIRQAFINGNELPSRPTLSYNSLVCADELLTSLVATGRLFAPWETTEPLSLDEAPELKTDWLALPNRNTLSLRIFNKGGIVELLPTNPPWFLSVDRLKIGRVSGIPETVIKTVSANFEITQADIPALHSQLAERKLLAEFPPLPSIEVIDKGVLKPKPIIELIRADHKFMGDGVFGYIYFDYDGHRITPTSAPLIEIVTANACTRIHRDFDQEKEYLNSLEEITNCRLEDSQTYIIIGLEEESGEHFLWTGIDFQEGKGPKLAKAGWHLELSESFRFEFVPDTTWELDFSEHADKGWYNVELSLEHNGEKIDLIQILRHMLTVPGFVEKVRLGTDDKTNWRYRTGDKIVNIPISTVRQLALLLLDLNDQKNTSGKPPKISRFDVALLGQAGAGNEIRLRNTEVLEFHKRLLTPPPALPSEVYEGIALPLRPYQEFGVSWMRQRQDLDVGVILGDEMAIGKTVQSLAHIWGNRSADGFYRCSLIVVPTTLISKWLDEAIKFFPSMRVGLYHGAGRATLEDLRSDSDAVLTTYGTLSYDIPEFLKFEWHIMAMDEAHDLRNPKADKTRACRAINATQKIAISGTIIQNRPEDLWSIADIVAPGLLRDQTWFKRSFVKKAREGELLANERLHLLGMLTSPYHLHRSNKDVSNALPPVNVIYRLIDLGPQQRRLYEATRATIDKDIRRLIAESGLAKSQISILAAITRLRQICCHPSLLKSESVQDHQESAKLEFLMQMMEELSAEGKKAVVTSEWVGLLEVVAARMEKAGLSFSLLTGKQTPKQRAAIVNGFKNGDKQSLLMSLGVGGEGLDLPEGDVMIVLAPWWNPKKIDQAIARLRREYRDKTITAYILVAKGTLEEGVVEIGKKKGEMIAAVMEGESAAATGGLTISDIELLLSKTGHA